MRIDYFAQAPAAITQLRKITSAQEKSSLRALVESRVSQLNGCVYCVHLHLREARRLGESQNHLDSLAVWHESPLFDAREKAALAWAETLTRMADTQADESTFSRLKIHFSDREIVELTLAIGLANFWNRIASGFRRDPDLETAIEKSDKS